MKRAHIFWFTGLSGSGKTTVALAVKILLEKKGLSVLVVDGDEIRSRRHRNLGFTEADIKMNNEWIAEHCREERGKVDVILVPIISPYVCSRQKARETLAPGFYEIYFNAGLECVIARDAKGLYQKAKNGEIKNLIGFFSGSPYQAPEEPDLVVSTDGKSPEESVSVLLNFILRKIDASFPSA